MPSINRKMIIFSQRSLITTVRLSNICGCTAWLQLSADPAQAIPMWRQAAKAQDELGYDEPPAFYYPVRESLGGVLLRAGKPAEAESIFRECLQQNPRDPRALFGLSEALKAQGKSDAADSVRRLFSESWKKPDVALRVQDL